MGASGGICVMLWGESLPQCATTVAVTKTRRNTLYPNAQRGLSRGQT